MHTQSAPDARPADRIPANWQAGTGGFQDDGQDERSGHQDHKAAAWGLPAHTDQPAFPLCP